MDTGSFQILGLMARGSPLALHYRWNESVLELWLCETKTQRVRRYLRSDSGEILGSFTDRHNAGIILADTSGFPFALTTVDTKQVSLDGKLVSLNLSEHDATWVRQRLIEAGLPFVDVTAAAREFKTTLDAAIRATTGRPRLFWTCLAAIASLLLVVTLAAVVWRYDPETNREASAAIIASTGLAWLAIASTAWAATEGIKLQLKTGRTPSFNLIGVLLAAGGIVAFPLAYQVIQYIW